MDFMQALAIIWNIPPASATSSNYITSSVMSDTTCKAQAPEQMQLHTTLQTYYRVVCSVLMVAGREGEANSYETKPKIRGEPNAFIKLL